MDSSPHYIRLLLCWPYHEQIGLPIQESPFGVCLTLNGEGLQGRIL